MRFSGEFFLRIVEIVFETHRYALPKKCIELNTSSKFSIYLGHINNILILNWLRITDVDHWVRFITHKNLFQLNVPISINSI